MPKEQTYPEALELCSNLGAHLVSYASSHEADFVTSHVHASRNGTFMTFVWLSMNENATDGKKVWTWTHTGMPVFDNPDVNLGCRKDKLKEKCVAVLMIHPKKPFQYMTCSYDCAKSEVFPVCEINLIPLRANFKRTASHTESTSEMTLTSIHQSDRCEEGWDIYGDMCYHLDSVAVTGEEARGECMMKYSAKPVSVTSSGLQNFLKIIVYQKDHGLSGQAGHFKEQVLLGGRTKGNGIEWTDGSSSEHFSAWEINEPVYENKCVTMDRSGKWKSVPCGRPNQYRTICGWVSSVHWTDLVSWSRTNNWVSSFIIPFSLFMARLLNKHHFLNSKPAKLVESETSGSSPALPSYGSLPTSLPTDQQAPATEPGLGMTSPDKEPQIKNASTMVITIAAVLVAILLVICLAVRLRKRAQNEQRIGLQPNEANGNVYADPRSEKQKTESSLAAETEKSNKT